MSTTHGHRGSAAESGGQGDGHRPPAEPLQTAVPQAASQHEITFDSLNLHPDLLRGIHDLGFIRPTPIQAQAIPPVMAGRDVIGCAQTGTEIGRASCRERV